MQQEKENLPILNTPELLDFDGYTGEVLKSRRLQ